MVIMCFFKDENGDGSAHSINQTKQKFKSGKMVGCNIPQNECTVVESKGLMTVGFALKFSGGIYSKGPRKMKGARLELAIWLEWSSIASLEMDLVHILP